MYGLEILVNGKYDIRNVNLIGSGLKRSTTPKIEEIIEEKWQKRVSQNPNLFNGKLLSFSDYRYDSSKIEIITSETTFKEHVGCLEGNLLSAYPKQYISWPLNFHTSITTSDDRILIGLRSENVYDHKGNYALFGGVISPQELKRFTAEEALTLELNQEILNPSFYPRSNPDKKSVCFGVVRNNKSYNVTILFNTQISLNSKEIVERVEYDKEKEHRKIKVLANDPREIKRFIDDNKSTTVPQCLALLELYIKDK